MTKTTAVSHVAAGESARGGGDVDPTSVPYADVFQTRSYSFFVYQNANPFEAHVAKDGTRLAETESVSRLIRTDCEWERVRWKVFFYPDERVHATSPHNMRIVAL